MKKKTFRIALIYETWVSDTETFATPHFSEAHKKACDIMRADKLIVSCLIYSNQNTAMVLQRKWAKP